VLYGIYHAKQSIAKEDNCYLVEGYTDVIQFYQTGIKNVVSSSGTALTSDQIRLINRLTKNITVLFDGDAAGMRASLRGIDLILEQGMNVKVCTFPEGEDPDSFAKSNTLEELTAYIVTSISKIPDRIKTEVYIQECARIMDISEDVLFTTLAQLQNKDLNEASKQKVTTRKAFDVIKTDQSVKKVDVQYELERKIIEILLLYGNRTEEFEDSVLKENENGDLGLEKVVQEAKVFEKIFLDLQEDEMEFLNPKFKAIYYEVINGLNQDPNFKIENLINTIDPILSQEITSIMMEDEKYSLADWRRNNIFPKSKIDTISQLVSETILTLRCFLIDQKVADFQQKTLENKTEVNKEILEEVKDYSSLKMLLSRKLKRAL